MPELTVWATRPEAQNKGWCELLNEHGFTTIAAPLLAIEPLTEPASVQAIKARVLDLDHYQALIFVSQNAVEHGVDAIEALWPQWPVQQDRIAIGVKTASLLRQYVEPVICPEQGMDTASVLRLPPLRNPEGKRILIFRGRGGLPELGAQLSAAGARVDYCELYERQAPDISEPLRSQLRLALRAGHCVVSVFSGETLINLNHFLQSNNLPPKHIAVLVPGLRVAKMAAEQGFISIIQATNATESAMLSALNQWLGR